ncbi:MAG: riboflavin synthase [Candidatus Oxydemutatoraceae bacterium WSBS_2016_MAG_OTU14]
MFSGIVQTIGQVETIQFQQGQLKISANEAFIKDLNLGDSVSVNGVCLTVCDCGPSYFIVDLSEETLRCTTFNALVEGQQLNLEPSLRFGDILGGHLVSGHVDAVGEVLERIEDNKNCRVQIECPANLAPYIARKGSICIDGVSLTVNAVDNNRFWVQLIPYTIENTLFKEYSKGSKVNLEVDMIARYIARQLEQRN